jgi:hypothetical protein
MNLDVKDGRPGKETATQLVSPTIASLQRPGDSPGLRRRRFHHVAVKRRCSKELEQVERLMREKPSSGGWSW